MSTHSIFSPSAAHRVLRCPPSLRLNAELPDESTSYAAEGTSAHALCAYLVEKALGRNPEDPTENLDYYNAEMQECADGYAAFVMEEYENAKRTCPDAQIFVEQLVSFSRWVPDCGGTADCIIIADGQLEIIDFKYGLGVLVEASDKDFGGNPQLMCYCLGALDMFDGIYDVDTCKMVIYQPRKENVSEHTMARDELLSWADNTLAPIAALALEGKGEFAAGDHCRFCKVKATCRKRAEYNLSLAKYDFQKPAMLQNNEIDEVLLMADKLSDWASDVRNYALKQAISGTNFEHFKLVASSTNRKYSDEAAVAKAVTEAGFDPYEKKLLGITAMSKLLGKDKFNTLLGKLIVKPEGKPTLELRTDKRPEMNLSAENDFKGV